MPARDRARCDSVTEWVLHGLWSRAGAGAHKLAWMGTESRSKFQSKLRRDRDICRSGCCRVPESRCPWDCRALLCAGIKQAQTRVQSTRVEVPPKEVEPAPRAHGGHAHPARGRRAGRGGAAQVRPLGGGGIEAVQAVGELCGAGSGVSDPALA